MKKETKIVIAIVLIIAIIAVGVLIFVNSKKKDDVKNVSLKTSEDLEKLISDIYKNCEGELPRLETREVDITDESAVKSATGLENGDDLELLLLSEPLNSSQAYSLVVAKVKSGVNTDDIAKEMKENIDPRKWICVSAEKIYVATSGDIVFLVMSQEDWAKNVYNEFKNTVEKIDNEYEVSVEEEPFPDDLRVPIVY